MICPRRQRSKHGSTEKEGRRAQSAGAQDGEDDGGTKEASGAQTLISCVPSGTEAASDGGLFHFGSHMDALCAPAERPATPRATAVAHAWLREPVYRELESEAARRREHADAVAAKIITAAIILGAVDELIERAEKLLGC